VTAVDLAKREVQSAEMAPLEYGLREVAGG
jgi:hypothetical protein